MVSIFYVHPENWGFMIQFDEYIFQMGWFNHQPVMIIYPDSPSETHVNRARL